MQHLDPLGHGYENQQFRTPFVALQPTLLLLGDMSFTVHTFNTFIEYLLPAGIEKDE